MSGSKGYSAGSESGSNRALSSRTFYKHLIHVYSISEDDDNDNDLIVMNGMMI